MFFSKEFVEPRPLLQALEQAKGCVLLVDEIDKSDAEFESLLLEILSDYQVTIPELGTVTAIVKPTVILTSNGERDLSDALKRRCLHLHIGFPEQKLEERIVESRVPGISATLRKQIVGFINQVRALDLKKLPSVSETIDWARVLVLLQSTELDHETVKDTLNVLLKYEADIETTSRRYRASSPRPAAKRVRLMREELHRFFRAARGAGVRVSPAESIDAMSAVADVGFAERDILRDTLSADARQEPGGKAGARRLFRSVLQPAGAAGRHRARRTRGQQGRRTGSGDNRPIRADRHRARRARADAAVAGP